MELFSRAKAVRLKSHHDKYLLAEDDEEHVCQDRNGSSRNARWSVELVDTTSSSSSSVLRLRSCYGRYLTASNEPFLLGMTGRKVLQTLPRRLDSSVEWEPIRDGFQVRLKTRYGHFLRANGGVPPWRNSITHDIPHRTSTQDWVLWDVDVVEILQSVPSPLPHHRHALSAPSLDDSSSSSSPRSTMSPRRLSRDESSSSFTGSPHKLDGRTIHYVVVEEQGAADDSTAELSFAFKGTSVAELTQKLEEETEIRDGIIVCSRNPLNGKLYPLRLHLPPNNTTMHVVVVPASSKLAKSF